MNTRRPGRVYLLRGIFDIWSLGLDRLATQLRLKGYEATVLSNGQWHGAAQHVVFLRERLGDREPIILIGHSSGGSDAIHMARRLGESGIETDLLVVVDTVMAPKVPATVQDAYNLYLGDGVPHGVELRAEDGFRGRLSNVDIRRRLGWVGSLGIDHFNIDDQAVVLEAVAARVEGLLSRSAIAPRTIR